MAPAIQSVIAAALARMSVRTSHSGRRNMIRYSGAEAIPYVSNLSAGRAGGRRSETGKLDLGTRRIGHAARTASVLRGALVRFSRWRGRCTRRSFTRYDSRSFLGILALVAPS